MMIIFLLIICNLLHLVQNSAGTPITSSPLLASIPDSSTGVRYYWDVSGVSVGQFINVQFEITTPSVITSTFVMLSYDDDDYEPGQVTRQNFYGKQFDDFQGIMDITNMQTGNNQYINKVWNGQSRLYFTVFNLDPPSRRQIIQFRIFYSSSSGKVNFPCNGGVRNLGSSTCRNCPAGFYGENCAINMLQLSNGVTSSVTINGPQMKYFMITQTDQVNVLVKQSIGYGQAYFQFVQFDGQFASYTNVAVGRTVEGRFPLLGGTRGTTITARSSGSPMVITIAVYDSISTQIEIYYEIQTSSNLLLIVLGSIGGVLLVVLLIGGCYIVRKSTLLGQQQSRAVRPNIDNQLSSQEIQRFFPTIIFKDLKNAQDGTMENINQPQRQVGEDCVICLCQIQAQNEVKITFCKHIFHANCLVGWFAKQQNCPYCRQECNKSNTIKLYRQLKSSLDNKVLKGSQLVKAIANSKKSTIASKQEIQQKTMQQVIVRPNRFVQVENLNS